MYTDKNKGIPYQNIVDIEVAFEILGLIIAILEKLNEDKYKQAKKIYSSLSIFDPVNTRNILEFFGPICKKIRDGEITLEYFAENIDIDFKPKVSIIIPVYNVSDYLIKAINSLRVQTLKNIEIICVDDASTDNSLPILENFAKIDSRIKLLKHDKNLGVSCARNSGLSIAKSDYFMFLDPDDHVKQDFCEKMLKAIESDNYDLAVCDVNIEVAPDMPNNRGYTNSRDYAMPNTVWCWNKIFKRKLIIENRIKFPEGLLGEDAYFTNCYRLVSNKNYAIVKEKLYTYLVRKNSLMSAFDTPDNEVVFDCFSIAESTYKFFMEQKEKNNDRIEKVKISKEELNRVYDHFFKSINTALNYFSTKYNSNLAKRIYELLKDKREIKVVEGGFEVNIDDEKRFYETKNKEVLKGLLTMNRDCKKM